MATRAETRGRQRGEPRLRALAPLRTVALGIGFVCAIAASVMIFVTDDAQFLRIGILVAVWGFVFAALAASRRQAEQALAISGEIELRKSYELELEREVVARREYELRVEAQLRREVQESFTSQVGGLHEEVVRLRRELSEQWDSELRVERMVMRTQSVRMGADRRGSLEAAPIESAMIDAVPADESDESQGRVEVPIRGTDSAPSVPTTPVPALDTSPPTAPTAPRPESAWDFDADPPYAGGGKVRSNDILARVLAEAGGSAGNRRRRHGSSNDDEDAVPARS